VTGALYKTNLRLLRKNNVDMLQKTNQLRTEIKKKILKLSTQMLTRHSTIDAKFRSPAVAELLVSSSG